MRANSDRYTLGGQTTQSRRSRFGAARIASISGPLSARDPCIFQLPATSLRRMSYDDPRCLIPARPKGLGPQNGAVPFLGARMIATWPVPRNGQIAPSGRRGLGRGGGPARVRQLVGTPAHVGCVTAFDHDADHRLGAGGAQNHPPLALLFFFYAPPRAVQ